MTRTANSTAASAAAGTMAACEMNTRTLKQRAAFSPRATVAFSVLDLVADLRKSAQSALVYLQARGHNGVRVGISSAPAAR